VVAEGKVRGRKDPAEAARGEPHSVERLRDVAPVQTGERRERRPVIDADAHTLRARRRLVNDRPTPQAEDRSSRYAARSSVRAVSQDVDEIELVDATACGKRRCRLMIHERRLVLEAGTAPPGPVSFLRTCLGEIIASKPKRHSAISGGPGARSPRHGHFITPSLIGRDRAPDLGSSRRFRRCRESLIVTKNDRENEDAPLTTILG
jgi:hypothetical protein